MANQNVLFYKATKDKFNALVEKNPLAIYFVEDIPAIYVGDILFAVGSEVTSTFSGLISPEYKAKLDTFMESGGSDNSSEIESILQELALKVNATDVYTKQEVDDMISAATANMVTYEKFTEVQNTVTTLETKVETSTGNVDTIQTVIEQKADVETVTELQTIVEQKVDIETVEKLETDLKTYIEEMIKNVEAEDMDGGEIV